MRKKHQQNPNIILIAALGQQNQIGLNGTMPWHLSDDLKNFKKITSGHTIIMGRKTFDSIGKALPKRMNYIITSQPDHINAYEVCSFNSLQKAIDKARIFDDKIFIIGGASIYEQSLGLVDTLIITRVNYSGKADTFMPAINWHKWQIVDRKSFKTNDRNDYNFEVITYKRLNHI